MRKLLFGLVGSLFCVGTVIGNIQQPESIKSNKAEIMSLESVIKQAYLNNPELKAAVAEKQARDEELAKAFSEYYPEIYVKLSTGLAKNRARPGDMGVDLENSKNNDNSASLVLSQNIFNGLGTKYRVEAAESNVIANRHAAVSKMQEVILKIIRVYMELWAAEQNVVIAEKLKENLQVSLDSEERKLQVGTTTVMDCEQKRAAHADAVYDLSSAKADLKRALAEFKAITCIEPYGNAFFPKLKISLPKTFVELVEKAMKNNPELLSAKFREYAAGKNVNAAKSALSPRMDLELLAENSLNKQKVNETRQRDRKKGVLSARVNVIVPILNKGGASFSEIRQSNKMALKASMDYRTAIFNTEQNCKTAWANYIAAGDQIEQSRVSVESAAKTVEGLRQSEKIGKVSSTDVVYNERNLLNSRRKEIDAQKKLILAMCQIVLCEGLLDNLIKNLHIVNYDLRENETKVRHAPFSF